MLGLVQSVSSKAAVANMATHASIKLAAVEPLIDPGKAAAIVAAHYAEPLQIAEAQLARAEEAQTQAGF